MADATIAPCGDDEVKAMGDEEAKFKSWFVDIEVVEYGFLT